MASNDYNFSVYDNVLNEQQIERWKQFYTTQAEFSWNKIDSNREGKYFLQSTGWTIKRTVEMFNTDEWIEPYIKPVMPQVKMTNFHDAYVNALIKGDDFARHRDIDPDEVRNDQYYVSCILYLNPYIEETAECGTEMGDEVVPYKFNRLVVFDGRIMHKPLAPVTDDIRLSFYTSFTNCFKVRFNEHTVAHRNPWHRNTIINQKFTGQE